MANTGEDISQAAERLRVVVGTDMTIEEKMEVYDADAASFDKVVEGNGYTAPEKCCDVMCKYITDSREKLEILDVGVGTGLLGELLYEKGFKTIDGIDPSKGMVEEAEKKNVYRNLYCDYFTASQMDIFANNFYDVTVSCGCFNPGHLPYKAVIEMIRITKPGGLVILSVRTNQLEGDTEYKEFFPLCDRLEQEGKWKKEEATKYDGYIKRFNVDGLHLVYRVK